MTKPGGTAPVSECGGDALKTLTQSRDDLFRHLRVSVVVSTRDDATHVFEPVIATNTKRLILQEAERTESVLNGDDNHVLILDQVRSIDTVCSRRAIVVRSSVNLQLDVRDCQHTENTSETDPDHDRKFGLVGGGSRCVDAERKWISQAGSLLQDILF